MKRIFLLIALTLGFLQLQAATENFNVHFETASHLLSKEEIFKLAALSEANIILLKGHTDSDGDSHYNLALSKERVKTVRKHLVALGIPQHKIETSYFGEVKPLNNNANYIEKQQNRRVEITFVKDALLNDRSQLQLFEIDPNHSQTFITDKGIIFTIDEKTFDQNVRLEVKEYFDAIDILAQKLSTHTNDGQLLESGGMFQIMAYGEDGSVVQPAKPIQSDFSALDLKDGFELYKGNRNTDMNMEWALEDEIIYNVCQSNGNDSELTTEMDLIPNSTTPNSNPSPLPQSFTSYTSGVEVKGWTGLDTVAAKWNTAWAKISNEVYLEDGSVDFLGTTGWEIVIERKNGKLRIDHTIPSQISDKERLTKIERKIMTKLRAFGYSFPKDLIYVKLYAFPFTMNFSTEMNMDDLNVGDAFSYIAREANGQDAPDVYTLIPELGWYNIDQLLKEQGKVYVKVIASEKTDVQIILKDYQSYVSNSVGLGGNTSFELPYNEPIIILAFKMIDGEKHVAVKETIAKNRTIDDLGYEPLSQTELAIRINKLVGLSAGPTAQLSQ